MTAERIILMRLLVSLGMTEEFSKTASMTLRSEDQVVEMLKFLKKEMPKDEELITDKIFEIKGL